ncbi:MAG: hypothetical protein CME62_12790 [Halobacteriovoraceae bacterium]|nr:hypothetical protein [Halobacteriovoraceae bacterium]
MKIFAIFLLGVSNFVFAEANPGQNLLNYFSATCESQRNWTQLALNDARNLMDVIASIRDDEDCKSVAGAVSQLGNLENKLTALSYDYTYQKEIAALEAQEIEILSQLSVSENTDTNIQLEGTLREIQIQKASQLALNNQYTHYNGGELRYLYSTIINSTATAFKAISNNQLCLDKHPGLLSSVTSLSTSVAASSAMVNPALGLGLATITDFIGNTVEYFRSRGHNFNIRNIANGSTVLEGLKCAMESLTKRWCDITEAEEFLKFEASKNRSEINIKSELNVISDLYDIDVPVLLNWLEKVKAGAPAANSADAGRRSSIIYRRATVESAVFLGQGFFSESRPLYDSATDVDTKFGVLRSVINKILTTGPLQGGSSILSDIVQLNFIPYYLLGFDLIPSTSTGEPIPWDTFDPRQHAPGRTFKFQTLVQRYEKWMTDAQARVTQEYSIVSQPDPLQILSTFFERTSNVWKKSPEKAVLNIIKFIQDNKPENVDANFDELYTSTINKLVNIYNAVKGENSSQVNCDDENRLEEGFSFESVSKFFSHKNSECDLKLKAIEIIFNEAQLETGVIVFQNRLETIIRVAIDQYIQNAEVQDQRHITTLLAANSYLDALKVVSGTDNYAQIMFDLQKAKPIAMNNMINFGKYFDYHINQLFKNNNHLVNSPDAYIQETYHTDRAHMCLLLASLPTWPEQVYKNYCYGMQLQSIQEGGPSTPVITEEFLNKSFKERSCIFNEFLERSKIYQDWGIKIGD